MRLSMATLPASWRVVYRVELTHSDLVAARDSGAALRASARRNENESISSRLRALARLAESVEAGRRDKGE